MKKLTLYQVDAFTDKLFGGNPAAVCPLEEWIDESLMQKIASENNLSETAFFVKKDDVFEIRWFTPTIEVDLCGHATLATAFILFNQLDYKAEEINFYSHRSGILKARKQDHMIFLDFPADELKYINTIPEIIQSIGITPVKCYKGNTDYFIVLNSEKEVLDIEPDFKTIATLPVRGIIITAKGDDVDFVSRFFAPQTGVHEDPVTGSAHTSLAPFWSNHLEKDDLTARQLSKRGGHILCKHIGDRVLIGGSAVLYLTGEICIND